MVAAVLGVRYDHDSTVIFRLLKLACAAPLLVPLAGCTGNVDAANAPDADASELTAAISIDTTSYADDVAPSHSTAVARFIRGNFGIDQATLQMLGASIDLPPNGSCSGTSSHETTSSGHSVELVDVGAITLDVAGRSATLAPRNVPDMNDLVWGVVYSSRVDGENAPVSGSISLRVAGSKDIGALSIDVADMSAPTDVVFDDATFLSGGDLIALHGNSDVRVTWTTSAPSHDVIYFEVANGTETLVCAYDDSGSALLPASMFAAAPDGKGTLAIHRLHREAVAARGIDNGEARFDFARVYDFITP